MTHRFITSSKTDSNRATDIDQEIGNTLELIKDDMNGELSALASGNLITRFTWSINHPEVLGEETARHAVSNQQPRPNPMTLDDATAFMRDVAGKWIKAKTR